MNSQTQRILLWIGAALAIIGFFAVLIYIGKAVPDVRSGDQKDWVAGSLSASAVLIEYGDFECPGCGAVHPFITQAQKEFGNKLTFIFRHFPLPGHQNALPAAWAAEAAGKQGKFWEMHDILYERQTFWSKEANPEEKFTSYAVDVLSLNKDQFLKDYRSEEVHKKVEEARQKGEKEGITGTPTLFVNGKLITKFPQSYEDLKSSITKALEISK